MAVICWGNLGKTADDNTRIEQSIQDYVEDHNENPNAHQIEGSSLYMHRINEQLDHMAGSVNLLHMVSDSYLLWTGFESIDGWQLTGNKSTNVFGSGIYTNTTTNHISEIIAWDVVLAKIMDFTKNPFFQTTVFFTDETNQIAYFGCGRKLTSPTSDSFGFKIEGNNLYAWWTSNGVEYTEDIVDVDITAHNVYRAMINSDTDVMEFYINGNLMYSTNQNIPILEGYYIYFYRIQTLEDVRKTMYFMDLLVQINR